MLHIIKKDILGGGFPDGPMVRNPSGIQSLVGELRSQKLCGVAKKKKKKKNLNIFVKINFFPNNIFVVRVVF